MLRVLALVWAGPLGAQLVCYEGFEEYGAGVQVESGANGSSGTPINGGTGWGGAYDVTDTIKNLITIEDRTPEISAGPVSFSEGEIDFPGGVRALRFNGSANGGPGQFALRRRMGMSFSAVAGQSLWFSVLFRTNAGSPLVDQDFFQIGFDSSGSPSSGNPRVSIGSNTISSSFPSGYHFFARSSTTIAASGYHSSLPIASTTTYLLVGQILPGSGAYNTVNLFVNPASLDNPGPPSATSTATSGLTTLSHLFIRTVGLDSGDAYVLDELRIGRNYASVAGSLDQLLVIAPAPAPGGSPTLSWPALMPGVLLESSATLAPDSWNLVSAGITNSAGKSSYTIPFEPGTSRLFFRLRR